jgi:hypothetical protein
MALFTSTKETNPLFERDRLVRLGRGRVVGLENEIKRGMQERMGTGLGTGQGWVWAREWTARACSGVLFCWKQGPGLQDRKQGCTGFLCDWPWRQELGMCSLINAFQISPSPAWALVLS